MMRKPGTVAPVIYFVRKDGFLFIAPYTDAPCPEDCRREYADTLPDIDRFVAKMREQEKRAAEQELLMEESYMAPQQQALHDRMVAHMVSAETDEFNKEIYRNYFKLKDEKKKKKYQQILEQRQWYLWARENDLGKRSADKEVYDCNRLEIK